VRWLVALALTLLACAPAGEAPTPHELARHDQTVRAFHVDVLGRPAREEEVAHWQNALRLRIPLVDVARALLTSAEARAIAPAPLTDPEAQAAQWYARYLRRAPDASAVSALRAGASPVELQANILASAEYATLHSCRPTTCAEQGKECGSIPDGCGGALQCGACAAGTVCGAVRPNVCGAVCRPRTCAETLADCGAIPDGCGGTVQCGACSGGATCGGGGVANVCGGGGACKRLACSDVGVECGVAGDGCGGLLDCGICR